MKAIILARVSTEEQKEAGNSLPAQVERLKKYCKSKDFEIIKTYSFDESAYKEKRDEFDKILEDIRNTNEVLAICFDKVDRLSRNIFDKRVADLYGMANQGKIELHFASDHQIIKGDISATEKSSFSMNLVMASYYSNAVSDNTKRALEQKRRNGEWTGPAPIGYSNVSLDEEKRLRKDIIIDPINGPIVKKLFESYASGRHSITTLHGEAIKLGLKTSKFKAPSRSTIENMLKNTFYYGIAHSKKYGSYPHKYPRIINKELFDKCTEVRLGRQKSPSKALAKQFVLGSGLVKCQNCGCSISFEAKKKPSGKIYNIGSCTNAKGVCKREYVNENDLLEPIYELLDKFGTISEETQKGLVNELRKHTEAEVVFHKTQIERIRRDYDKIKKMDDNLLEMRLEESITKDIYDKKHQEYRDKLQKLNIELDEHRNADYEYQTTVSTVLSVARRARSIFENCSEPQEKRAFLNMLLQNPTIEGKKLYFSIASPFDLVLDLASSPDWLRGLDSNQ
jgi:site-specific DNA recombinase